MLKYTFLLAGIILTFQISFAQSLETPVKKRENHSIINRDAVPPSTLFQEQFNSSDKTISYKNKFQGLLYSNPEVNFSPNGHHIYAGDINGDGTDDAIRSYSGNAIADNRTEDLSDFTSKSLVFFGNNLTTEHDQLVYAQIWPVGDLNGDGFADALGENLDNTLNFYFGSEEGYLKNEMAFADSLQTGISGFRDFNNDGYGDILSYYGGFGSLFHIIYGGADISDFTGKTYTLASSAVLLSADLNGDALVTVNLTSQPTELTASVIKINPVDLSLETSEPYTIDFGFSDNFIFGSTSLRAIDLNGDGLDEIYLPNLITPDSDQNSGMILEASAAGYVNHHMTIVSGAYTEWYPLGDIDKDGRGDFASIVDNAVQIGFGPSDLSSGLTADGPLLTFDEAVPSILLNSTIADSRNFRLGDFNDDGIEDFSILLTSEEEFGQRLFFGNANRDFGNYTDLLYPLSEFSRSPRHLESANLGDINDDGTDDLALLFDSKTQIFYGGIFKDTPDIEIPVTTTRNSHFETGDFDGDDKSDLIITSWSLSDEENVLYIDIYFGDNDFQSGPDHTMTSNSLPDEMVGSLTTYDVANIGDFNNDGVDDFIVYYHLLGKVYLFYGRETISSAPDLILEDFDSDFGIEGLSDIQFPFGWRIISLGDINADGIDDFAMSDLGRTYSDDDGQFNSGVIFIYFGSNHSPGEIMSRPPDEVIVLKKEQFRDFRYFGYNLKAGDFNGDGHPDLIATPLSLLLTPNTGNPQGGVDAFLIFHGGPDFDGEYDQAFELPDDLFNDPDASQISHRFGEIVPIKDLNNDGSDEIFVGSRPTSTSSKANGILIMGGTSIQEDQIPALQFVAPNHGRGLSVSNAFVNVHLKSTVGDFDGDGIPELVIPQYTDRNFMNVPIYTFPVQNPFKDSQKIDFSLGNQTFTLNPISLEATATSALTVSFEVISGPATASDNQLMLTGAGTVVIQASQSGNDIYNPAPWVRQTLVVTKADQAISIETIEDKVFGEHAFSVNATSDSGLPVTLSILTGPATIDGNLVTITGTGEVIVEANQPGNDSYNAAPAVSLSFQVNQADQFISMTPIENKVFDDAPFEVSASSDSGLPVTLSISSGPGTITDNVVTITGVGEIFIAADQAGNENYNPATQSISVVVSKADQDITIPEIAPKTFGTDASFTVSGSATSGLPLTFSIVSGPGTINDNTVIITGAGDIVIKADQAGNENYNSMTLNITVSVFKADQSISFEAIEDKVFGDDPFSITATSDSNLPVTLSILTGPATISENTVTITGTGEITIEAQQEGNEDYVGTNAFAYVVVSKADQAISFETVEAKTFGDDPFSITASTDSGLPVALSIASGPATITDNTVTITGTGQIVVAAEQAGDDSFNPASGSVTVDVAKADQTITFEALTDKTIEDIPFDLSATANSGLAVSYTLVSGPASIDGNTMTLTGTPGTVEIKVSQEGNENYNAADEATQSFEVTLVTSLELEAIQRDVKVYPNPIQNTLSLEIRNMATHKLRTIQILNNSGVAIQNHPLSGSSNGVLNIDFSDLSEGLYFIRLTFEKGILVEKVLKRN